MNNSTGFSTIYSRASSGGTWTTETVVSGFVHDIKGNNTIVTAGTDIGVIYNNGSGWKTASLPSGVSPMIDYCASAVSKNKVVWAYFEKFGTTASIGEGIFYTTDFITWKQPKGNEDTVLFHELVTLGDSVFALTYGNDGVYIYDTITAGSSGTGINNYRANKTTVQCIPNPFKDKTTLQFELENRSSVALVIYTILGQTIYEMPAQPMEVGIQKIDIHLPESKQGMYFYTISVNGVINSGKVIKD